MNYLHRVAAVGQGHRRLDHVQRLLKVDLDEIKSLVDLAFVQVVRQDGAIVDLPTRGERRDGHFLRLTPPGFDWVTGNPMNVLIKALRAAPKKRLSLWKAKQVADDETLFAAVEVGWATVHYAGDQKQLSRLTQYDLKHSSDYTMNATSKTRMVA